MKRILLVAALFLSGLTSAFAACSQTTAQMKDNLTNTMSMTLGSGADGNCYSVNGGPDVSLTFSIASNTQSSVLSLLGTQGAQFNLTGTFVATVVGQVSNDNSNWVSVPLVNMTASPPVYIDPATGATVVGNYQLVGSQGARYARISVTYTSGTVAGSLTASSQASVTLGDYITYKNLITSLPAGTAIVGKFGIDQTSPGTTNGVQLNASTSTVGNTGSDPSSGGATPGMAFLALPATTTTQIIPLNGSTKTYVTSRLMLAGGTVNVTFKYALPIAH